MRAFEKAIALTGGIGTGKSSASAILSLFGFRVIDADKIAHSVLDSKANEISQRFGKEFILSDGRVDRKRLGKTIFADRELRDELESIVHPSIREEIEKASLEQERLGKPYLIDIPLFFERANYPIDRVITVYAPKELQIERIMKRDSLSKDETLQRIDAQMDIEEKRRLATWVIDNSGSLKQLQNECERIKDEILSSFCKL